MMSKLKYVGNAVLVLIGLLFVVSCGTEQPEDVTTPSQEAHYRFCGRLYNAQLNIITKMGWCGLYPGFDIPGFPPNPGYCGETYGARCHDQHLALDMLESCVAMMPVCLPQYKITWDKNWRNTCLNVYNRWTTRDECLIDEISWPQDGDR